MGWHDRHSRVPQVLTREQRIKKVRSLAQNIISETVRLQLEGNKKLVVNVAAHGFLSRYGLAIGLLMDLAAEAAASDREIAEPIETAIKLLGKVPRNFAVIP